MTWELCTIWQMYFFIEAKITYDLLRKLLYDIAKFERRRPFTSVFSSSAEGLQISSSLAVSWVTENILLIEIEAVIWTCGLQIFTTWAIQENFTKSLLRNCKILQLVSYSTGNYLDEHFKIYLKL